MPWRAAVFSHAKVGAARSCCDVTASHVQAMYLPDLEVIDGLDREKHELDTLDAERFLPDVIPQLMGLNVGESKTIEFEFPSQWDPADMAGRKAQVWHASCWSMSCHACLLPSRCRLSTCTSSETNYILQVTVKVREVLTWKLPELTLDMCRKLVKGEEVDSIESFREKAREAIQYDATLELQVRSKALVL